MKKTLGKTIRERRQALGLSQGDLAKKLGVQPSHVAYLESDQRRPSLRLLKRISCVLELDPRRLFVLCHPEARYLYAEDEAQERAGVAKSVWQQFLSNRTLLKRNRVTASELKLLEQVSLLSDVSNPRDFLFILNTVRQATEPDS